MFELLANRPSFSRTGASSDYFISPRRLDPDTSEGLLRSYSHTYQPRTPNDVSLRILSGPVVCGVLFRVENAGNLIDS